MFENPTRRVAAILLTALLLFSTIVVIPQNTVSAASETNVIGIFVNPDGAVKTLARPGQENPRERRIIAYPILPFIV